MTVLATGANGFMSSNVVREHIKEGEEVRVSIRKGSETKNIDELSVEKVYCDIQDWNSIRKVFEGCNTIQL